MRKAIFDWASRLLLRQGGYKSGPDAAFRGEEDYVLVEDRGSDVTVFCFAGLAVLFAGLPTFEFRRLLSQHGPDYNLVFFRDVRRSGYHLRPDGLPGGLQFYEEKVHELVKSLGSTYNVSLGASAGGGAAFYFGTRCGMDQIVAFSPGFPMDVYTHPFTQLNTYLNLKKLAFDPTGYIEVVMVTVGALMAMRTLRRVKGMGRIWNVHETYKTFRMPRPRGTVFYGADCLPDSNQAQLMRDFKEVKLVPLPCGRHNCAAYLKQRGDLGSAIVAEIEEGLQAAHREDSRREAPQ